MYIQLAILCYIVWLSIWGIGSLYNLFKGPRVAGKGFEPKWSNVVMNLLIGVTVLVMCWNPRFLMTTRFPAPVQFAGSLILVSGTIFAVWARIALGRMWSSSAKLKVGHELRTGGPYRIVRHPIYVGLLAMVVGSVLIFGLILLPVFLFEIIGIVIKIRTEEKLMAATFGTEYLEYRKRVPMLVPRVKWMKRLIKSRA